MPLGQGPCTQCLSAEKTSLAVHSGKPSFCTQFDLTTCKFYSTIYKRCNGTKGIICYTETSSVTPYIVADEQLREVGPGHKTPCTKCTEWPEGPQGQCTKGQLCWANGNTYSMCKGQEKVACFWITNNPILDSAPNMCSQCVHTTITGNVISKTLVYHSHRPPTYTSAELPTCQVNGTIYKRYQDQLGVQYYDPTASP